MMPHIRLFSYCAVIAFSFMQAGASLFALMTAVSITIEAPPESMYILRGNYAFDPDRFWNVFPVVSMLFTLTALILNWRSVLRTWVISGMVVGFVAAAVAILLIGPAQEQFFESGSAESGVAWRNHTILFILVTCASGFVYVLGLVRLRAQPPGA